VKASAFLLALSLATHCGSKDREQSDAPPTSGTTAPPTVASASAVALSPTVSTLPFIGELNGCDVDHEGLFLDVGSPSVDARRGHSVGPFTDAPAYERAGATFARIHTRRLAYDFSLLEPLTRFIVTLRGSGVISRQVSVYIDDRRVGILSLPRDEADIVATTPLDGLAAGAHVLTLRFGGGAQGADEPYAELDWIRIGEPSGPPRSYAPPTTRDIVTDVVLGGSPKRSLVLRSPSTVRCPVRVSPGMRIDTNVGFWGNGHGVATLRVVEDGESPQILAERKVTGGAGTPWMPLSVELDRFVGRVVGIEFVSSEATGGGRVAFGEPAVVGAHEQHDVPEARAVVLVVASGLDRRLIPPWGPSAGMPGIARLVRDGVAFDRYRVPTTVVASVMTSLLSGLDPRSHGVEDPYQRLPNNVHLLGERAAEANAHAAFFTGVPMTFPAFGFDHGWERYESFSPVQDVPATEPLARGSAWIKEQRAADADAKLLLVEHSRGGHPPWDVTRDEVGALPPEEYSGPLEPRAGAIVLSNLRSQRGPSDQRLSGDDWRRLHALEEAALRKYDSAVHRLLDTLDREGLYDRSLIVFMGDVPTGDPPGIPFAPSPPLREDTLLAPLIVKFPGGGLAGTSIGTMATTVDVTATVLHALGLTLEGAQGIDLYRLAKGALPLDGHPLVSTLGSRYSTRWGPWLLFGDVGRKPSLCLIDVDPACVNDAYNHSPFAAGAVWRRTYQVEVAARGARARSERTAVRVTPDDATQAALKVFGY
jgi:arylsulfatase A-like enzyme